ncbi:hypothetical protein EV175_003771, partial [Coemansia sp. RSA 1933]
MPTNVHASNHPLVRQQVSELRRASNTARQVRGLTDSIGRLLMYEATQDLALQDGAQETSPVGPYTEQHVATRIALVPILRSGLALLNAASDLLPNAE